ncbi:hypothetical protein Acsp04_30980 [Actinomadura sp. NBRC 104425]|nr:hypothetical protein Acsp04_30980 [Actinomadura sp. NBRC 104425]
MDADAEAGRVVRRMRMPDPRRRGEGDHGLGGAGRSPAAMVTCRDGGAIVGAGRAGVGGARQSRQGSGQQQRGGAHGQPPPGMRSSSGSRSVKASGPTARPPVKACWMSNVR